MRKKSGIKIKLSKKTKQLFVVAIAKNGRKLHHTENEKRRQSCFKNIIAAGKIYIDVLCGREPIEDEKGVLWIYDLNKEGFVKVI